MSAECADTSLHVKVRPKFSVSEMKARQAAKLREIREALVAALCSLGYGVHPFASAEEFVAENGERSWDCVITDIHMPGMSGFDLTRLLTSGDSNVPVIMITGRTEPELKARAVASGAVCLLSKPFASRALIGCLEKALNIH